MGKPLLIIGAGGHALVLLEILLAAGEKIIGLLDSDHSKHGGEICGVPVIGDDSNIDKYLPDDVALVNAVGSTGKNGIRRKLFLKYKQKGYYFASVIHRSAIVSRDVEVGMGTQIFAGAVVQPGVVIGENCIINTKASVDHECVLAAHVHIAPGATVCANVCLSEGVHVGAGATIIQGINIGEYTIVGAGAVVVNEQKDHGIVIGIPARWMEIK